MICVFPKEPANTPTTGTFKPNRQNGKTRRSQTATGPGAISRKTCITPRHRAREHPSQDPELKGDPHAGNCLQKTPVPPPTGRQHQEKQGPGPTSGKRRPGKKIHIIRISKMVHRGRKQFLPPDVLRGIRRLSFAYIDAHLA